MLAEAMTALAMACGNAVVQAASTDGWAGFRQQVARLFARGDQQRERAELARLDQTMAALDVTDAAEAERVQIRQEATWQTRFEALLESLDETEQEQVAAELRDLLDKQATPANSVSAGPGGLAVGERIEIRADKGSIAGGVIHGGASIGTPSKPDPSQG